MAWEKKAATKAAPKKAAPKAAPKKEEPKQERHDNLADDWLLWCFEQEQKGDWLRMTCKMSSKPPRGSDEKYGKGFYITVMARIQPDKDGWMTDIEEDDYGKNWIHASGSVIASDWVDKDGNTRTEITIWASQVSK